MMIILISHNLFIRLDFILSFNSGKVFPKVSIGVCNAVCIVIPATFIAATPVGAKISNCGLCRVAFF